MRHRLLVLLVMIGLAVACPSGPAWAHPGHELTARSAHHDVAVSTESVVPGDTDVSGPSLDARPTAHHHVPSALALVVGAFTLLAALPNRRRTFAIVLTLLLASFAFEGAFHAALHLRHLPHADGLTIGASPTPPASPDPDGAAPVAPVLTLLAEAPEPYDAPFPDIIVAVNRGRAPPSSPLS